MSSGTQARSVEADGTVGLDMAAGVEPWIVLPVQVFGGAAAASSGTRRLMAAVLADAIALYLKHRRSPTANGRILFRETEGWIESRDARELLSYESICTVLQIDAERLRNALRAHARSGGSLPADARRIRVSRGRKIRV